MAAWCAHSSMSSLDIRVGSGISHRFRCSKYLLKQIFKRLEPIKFHSDMNKGKNQAATRRPKSGTARIYTFFTFLHTEKSGGQIFRFGSFFSLRAGSVLVNVLDDFHVG